MTSSSGFMRTVSFQPSSLGSGGLIVPSQPTRLITCTLNRWKWMAWVSTPLWVIFQICVPSLAAHRRRGVGAVDDLGGRVDVAVGDGGLDGRVGERQLDPQGGVHPSVVQLEELLDGLGLHVLHEIETGDRSRSGA